MAEERLIRADLEISNTTQSPRGKQSPEHEILKLGSWAPCGTPLPIQQG